MQETTVFFLLLLAYGLAVAFGGWFVLHNDRRTHWHQQFQAMLVRANNLLGNVFGGINKRAARIRSEIKGSGAELLQTSFLHKKLLIISLAILVTPMILVMAVGTSRKLEGYADMPQSTDPVVLALLEGEQLVPPPPLPPDLFITQEVEAIRQDLAHASREWQVLDGEFRQRLLSVYKLMEKHGYQMALIEGYRSPERQTLLAQRGPQVTNVGAYQSFHQFGLAADSAFLRDGRLVISEKDPWAREGYRLYGEYAESVGLTWGGRWKMMDLGHIELKKMNLLGKR